MTITGCAEDVTGARDVVGAGVVGTRVGDGDARVRLALGVGRGRDEDVTGEEDVTGVEDAAAGDGLVTEDVGATTELVGVPRVVVPNPHPATRRAEQITR